MSVCPICFQPLSPPTRRIPWPTPYNRQLGKMDRACHEDCADFALRARGEWAKKRYKSPGLAGKRKKKAGPKNYDGDWDAIQEPDVSRYVTHWRPR